MFDLMLVATAADAGFAYGAIAIIVALVIWNARMGNGRGE